MSTEYYVSIDQEPYRPMSRLVNTGKGSGLVFFWAIHPHTLFTHYRVWVRSEYGKSWPIEGFVYDVLGGHTQFDYSSIGKGF